MQIQFILMQKCMTHSCGRKQETSHQKARSTQASQKSGEDLEIMDVSAMMKYGVKGNKILGCKTGNIKQEKGGCIIPAFSTKATQLLLGSLHGRGGVRRVMRRARRWPQHWKRCHGVELPGCSLFAGRSWVIWSWCIRVLHWRQRCNNKWLSLV